MKFAPILFWSLQYVAEALFWAVEIHPGSHCSLQCPDSTHSCAAEVKPNLYGAEHQHWAGIQA